MFDESIFRGGIPHAFFAELRASGAPVWAALDGSQPAWHLVRHAEVTDALRSWEAYSSHTGGTTLQDQSPLQVAHNTSLLHTDPPEHSRLRSLFVSAMNRARIEAITDDLAHIARELVAECVAAGGTDLPTDLASRMASYSLAHFLGVPRRHRDRFRRLSALMLADAVPPPEPPLGLGSALQPGEADLVSGSPAAAMVDLLLTFCYEGERRDALGRRNADARGITAKEVEDVLVILATAGTGMTMNAAATMVWQLSENWGELVTSDGELTVDRDDLVEESLRFATPLMHTRRTATEMVDARDLPIAPGHKVILWLASANFDERVFRDPYRFDPRRSSNPHVAFARHSPHHCLGAHLARLELRVLLDTIVSECRRVAALSAPRYLPSNFVNEMIHLPVRFEARNGGAP